jgi:hypothetical protein
MTIKQIQEFNRRTIICAVHNTEDYEEALRLEEKIFLENTIFQHCGSVYREYIPPCNIYQHIGKPLTLDRILIALQSQEIGFLNGYLFELEDKGYDGMMEQWICKWDLTKPTLEEQTEETQKAVAKLLGFGEGEND